MMIPALLFLFPVLHAQDTTTVDTISIELTAYQQEQLAQLEKAHADILEETQNRLKSVNLEKSKLVALILDANKIILHRVQGVEPNDSTLKVFILKPD